MSTTGSAEAARDSGPDSQPELPLPSEAVGTAPGRGRMVGRRVLVVGAGTQGEGSPGEPIGNGQAIARLAAREGAAVACADVNGYAAERTASAITAVGGTAWVLTGDVADAAVCERLVSDAAADGPLQGLVCNVGIGIGRGMQGTTPEAWDKVVSVNLRSHFLLARAALEIMPAEASVVLIGSVAGLQPGSQIPAYDATKAGLLGLNRHVAVEGARRGVRCNIVLPGLIDTPLGRWATAGRPGRGRTPVPLRRQGTAWEVAYATVFLLSDESSYITGQRLVVDGGLTWT